MRMVIKDPFFGQMSSGGGESKNESRAAGGGGGAATTVGVGECIVCLDAENTHSFIPCGHKCVCEACANTVMATRGECPKCRAEVDNVMRIYV